MSEGTRLEDWIGRRRSESDRAAAWPAEALAATLGHERRFGPGDPLPPIWHWLYFLEARPAGELGPDGHPRRGGFLPPVALPRRMWAGGRLRFHHPLHIGEDIRRESEIVSVTSKSGRSGKLVFVTLRHAISNAGGVATVEEHDIVYREAPVPGAAAPPSRPAPAAAGWRRELRPDPVLLFRFSALTFNGHRIHYDQPYATGEEGYPGLVVHGPLQALLLLELCRAQLPHRPVTDFEFRAISPVFDTAPFTLAGTEGEARADLWVAAPDGALAMTGSVGLGPPGAAPA